MLRSSQLRAASPPPVYPPPIYESDIDSKTVTIQEFNALRAEIRAATEIAAVSKFHVKSVEDKNIALLSKVKLQGERIDGLEEVVRLLLKEVSSLGARSKSAATQALLSRAASPPGTIRTDSYSPYPPHPSSPSPASSDFQGASPPPLSSTTPGEKTTWVEALDPKTGLIYYFNPSTHSTSWLPPSDADVQEISASDLQAMSPKVLSPESQGVRGGGGLVDDG